MSPTPTPPPSQPLSLTGDLTIYHALEQKTVLLDALLTRGDLELDLSQIGEIDTAGLQLMLIAKRNPGKEVSFINHPQSVLRLIDLANVGGVFGDPLFISANRS